MFSSVNRGLAITVLVLCSSCQENQHAPQRALAPSQGEGWSIQFCKSEIEAPKVELDIGADANSRKDWMVWDTSQDAKQLVPSEFQHVREIWVEGAAQPAENDVVFCLKYNGIAKRHYDFDDREDHKVDIDRHEGECRC
jgi:hypothetical protein